MEKMLWVRSQYKNGFLDLRKGVLILTMLLVQEECQTLMKNI